MDGEVLDRPELAAETSFDVLLYIYDLSKELAKSFKKILKGKPLPGIWHTGLVAYGREYYFGSSGIESCRPGETILGEPDQILKLGKTELPYSVFLEYIFAQGESTYKPGSYHLLEHNGNVFSQEVCQFLTGGPIPSEIRDLPQEISSNKNLSGALKEYFDKLSLKAEGSRGISFGPPGRIAEEHRNGHAAPENGVPAKPQQNGTKRKKSSAAMNPMVNGNSSATPSQKSKEQPKESPAPEQQSKQSEQSAPKTELPAAQQQPSPSRASEPNAEQAQPVAQPAAEPIPQANSDAAIATNGTSVPREFENGDDEPPPSFTPRRSRRYDDPPILFPNVDGAAILKRLLEVLEGKLNREERRDLDEMMEYLTTEGGAWALGTPHLETIGRLLNDRSLPEETPVLTLQVMQAAGLKEDVILLLHQDREKHHLMSYFYRIESLPENEQTEVAALLCNLCSNPSSYDWLTYISEWEEEGRPCSNSRVIVRAAVNALLSQKPETRDRGCALIYNLALKKELFDDIATELAMAVMQFLQSPLSEELVFQSLTALYRFMCISYNEVPALLKMLGPDAESFKGLSPRVDPIVEEILVKMRVARV